MEGTLGAVMLSREGGGSITGRRDKLDTRRSWLESIKSEFSAVVSSVCWALAAEEGGEIAEDKQQHHEHVGNWSNDDRVDLISCLKASNMLHCFWISSASMSGDLGIPHHCNNN